MFLRFSCLKYHFSRFFEVVYKSDLRRIVVGVDLRVHPYSFDRLRTGWTDRDLPTLKLWQAGVGPYIYALYEFNSPEEHC